MDRDLGRKTRDESHNKTNLHKEFEIAAFGMPELPCPEPAISASEACPTSRQLLRSRRCVRHPSKARESVITCLCSSKMLCPRHVVATCLLHSYSAAKEKTTCLLCQLHSLKTILVSVFRWILPSYLPLCNFARSYR